jgi:hypothetical protein
LFLGSEIWFVDHQDETFFPVWPKKDTIQTGEALLLIVNNIQQGSDVMAPLAARHS